VRGLLASLIAIGCSGLLACDGLFTVQGHVYAATHAAAQGKSVARIMRDSTSDTSGVSPVQGAIAELYLSARDTADTDKAARVPIDRTAPDGSFRIGRVASPWKFTAALRVRKDGYRTVTLPISKESNLRPVDVRVVLAPVDSTSTSSGP
jgi:hypothetical protein